MKLKFNLIILFDEYQKKTTKGNTMAQEQEEWSEVETKAPEEPKVEYEIEGEEDEKVKTPSPVEAKEEVKSEEAPKEDSPPELILQWSESMNPPPSLIQKISLDQIVVDNKRNNPNRYFGFK